MLYGSGLFCAVVKAQGPARLEPETTMKLKLPLALLASLTACMAYAQDSYSYTELDQVPIYGDVIGSAENDYTVKIVGSNGSCYDVNAKNVTWDSSHTYPKGHVLSVGSILTESTLNIVTPEGAQEETVVQTGANLFIGGWGWGIQSTDKLTPLTGKVVVKDATLLVTPNSGGDSSCSQLNVGQAGNYAETGSEGILEVDHGTVEAGAINVGMSRGTMGTVTVTNGGVLYAERRGDLNSSKNYTGDFCVAHDANSTGTVTIDGKSTLTVDRTTYIGMGYDTVSGAATGTLTVQGESTADLGMLVVGCYNSGSKGTVTVDNSTLTAGTTYLGFMGGTTGEITVKEGATTTMGNTYLGCSSGSSGEITVNTGATATMGQTLIGYYDGSSGKVSVDGAQLTAGNTWVGSSGGNGELSVNNGGKAGFDYLCAGDAVTVANGSEVSVVTDLEVGTSGKLTVTDGTGKSSVRVAGWLVNEGTIDAELTQGGSVTALAVENYGEMNVSLANKGSFTAAQFVNEGKANVDIAAGSSFSVGTYVNAGTGTTTISAADGATCHFDSLYLEAGSVKLDGEGSFELGSAESGVATAFYVSGPTTTTYMDISALGGNFTINAQSTFTLNFADETLAGIAAGSSQDFELHLVLGYEGFTMSADDLATLLKNTMYNIAREEAEAAQALLAMTTADATIDLSDYTVANAQYTMKGNDLVWTGTVKNNAAVPEPTTATLSLLALTALAARRRRK